MPRFARTAADVAWDQLALLLNALAGDETSFVLGAGASAPHIPLTSGLPDAFRAFMAEVSSWPAGPLPDSPFRRLLDPIAVNCVKRFEDWKLLALTDATLAATLNQVLHVEDSDCPPQYRVFRYFSPSASVVSFNWDGLARRFCPQSTVIHPHGVLRTRRFDPEDLRELLFWTQLSRDASGRDFLRGQLILLREEEKLQDSKLRRRIRDLWSRCATLVSIGYSFGTPETLGYDAVWRDTLLEAMRFNRAPIHLISPQAAELAGDLSERLGRSLDVYAWPFRWDRFSMAVLRLMQKHPRPVPSIEPRALHYQYSKMADAP